MAITDLYSESYTGELETILIEKDSSDQIINELRLATGQFTSVIDWIPFDSTSSPNSFIYAFNVEQNWGLDFSQIPRLQEFYDQLLSITNEVHIFYAPVLIAIKEICLSALQNNNILYIKSE